MYGILTSVKSHRNVHLIPNIRYDTFDALNSMRETPLSYTNAYMRENFELSYLTFDTDIKIEKSMKNL